MMDSIEFKATMLMLMASIFGMALAVYKMHGGGWVMLASVICLGLAALISFLHVVRH